MVPPVAVPTLAFYDYFRRSRPDISPREDRPLVDFVESGKGDLLSLVENDFEEAVCELEPVLGEGLRRARSVIPHGTALTGSGSVFFSLIQPGREALCERLSDAMKDLGVTCHVCKVEA
jgi:4-diphosphocytidyl-2C-methyl-D-erythritol kinase